MVHSHYGIIDHFENNFRNSKKNSQQLHEDFNLYLYHINSFQFVPSIFCCWKNKYSPLVCQQKLEALIDDGILNDISLHTILHCIQYVLEDNSATVDEWKIIEGMLKYSCTRNTIQLYTEYTLRDIYRRIKLCQDRHDMFTIQHNCCQKTSLLIHNYLTTKYTSTIATPLSWSHQLSDDVGESKITLH